jgi:hypothetical protein
MPNFGILCGRFGRPSLVAHSDASPPVRKLTDLQAIASLLLSYLGLMMSQVTICRAKANSFILHAKDPAMARRIMAGTYDDKLLSQVRMAKLCPKSELLA